MVLIYLPAIKQKNSGYLKKSEDWPVGPHLQIQILTQKNNELEQELSQLEVKHNLAIFKWSAGRLAARQPVTFTGPSTKTTRTPTAKDCLGNIRLRSGCTLGMHLDVLLRSVIRIRKGAAEEGQWPLLGAQNTFQMRT